MIESSEDEEELAAMALDIIEDAAAKKAKVVARQITSITPTNPEPIGDEEGENMEDIS